MTTKAPRKNSRKNAIMAISLVVALLITGAFAYLTDSDTATNTFTVGDVKIELMEPTWDDALDTDNDGNPDYANNIWAGKIIDKDPTIKNTGDNDAFVYMMVSIPKDIVNTTDVEGNPIVNTDSQNLFKLLIKPSNIEGINDGWTLQASKTALDNNEYYNYYLYSYNTKLAPDASTLPLFDAVEFVNLKDNHDSEDDRIVNAPLNLKIDAYAIQANFGNGAEAATPADAWNLYTNQNGWVFPTNLRTVQYSYIGINGDILNSVSYGNVVENDPTQGITLMNALTDIPDGYTFEGWADESGNLYAPGDEISVSDLLIIDPTTNEVINPNPTLTTTCQKIFVGDGNSNTPVKLIPVNSVSTAMIQRGDTVESYNNITLNYVGAPTVIDVNTATYGYNTAGEDFDDWLVYGLRKGLTVDELFTDYVKVQGNGYATVTASSSNAAGTGAQINVYDNESNLVESFHVIIFGDVNGDASITATDTTIIKREGFYFEWSEGSGYQEFMMMAADLNRDILIDATDVTISRTIVFEEGDVDQVNGTIIHY